MRKIIHGNRDDFLLSAIPEKEMAALRKHAHTGRPLGSDKFVYRLESQLDRVLRPKKPGRKTKPKALK